MWLFIFHHRHYRSHHDHCHIIITIIIVVVIIIIIIVAVIVIVVVIIIFFLLVLVLLSWLFFPVHSHKDKHHSHRQHLLLFRLTPDHKYSLSTRASAVIRHHSDDWASVQTQWQRSLLRRRVTTPTDSANNTSCDNNGLGSRGTFVSPEAEKATSPEATVYTEGRLNHEHVCSRS